MSQGVHSLREARAVRVAADQARPQLATRAPEGGALEPPPQAGGRCQRRGRTVNVGALDQRRQLRRHASAHDRDVRYLYIFFRPSKFFRRAASVP